MALYTRPWSINPFALSLMGLVGNGLSPIFAVTDLLNGAGELGASFRLPSFADKSEMNMIAIGIFLNVSVKIDPYKKVNFSIA